MIQSSPTDAPQTLANRELLQQGGLAQMLSRLPLGRPGFPCDLAKAVLFMASDMAYLCEWHVADR